MPCIWILLEIASCDYGTHSLHLVSDLCVSMYHAFHSRSHMQDRRTKAEYCMHDELLRRRSITIATVLFNRSKPTLTYRVTPSERTTSRFNVCQQSRSHICSRRGATLPPVLIVNELFLV